MGTCTNYRIQNSQRHITHAYAGFILMPGEVLAIVRYMFVTHATCTGPIPETLGTLSQLRDLVVRGTKVTGKYIMLNFRCRFEILIFHMNLV